MFQIDDNARRLYQSEKDQYLKEGYVTGLPVFSENAINNIHNCIFMHLFDLLGCVKSIVTA